MAQKNFDKGTKEWEFFRDLWQVAQSVWVPEDNDEYYERALSLITAFDRKYDTAYSHRFSAALLATITDFSKELGYEEGKSWN